MVQTIKTKIIADADLMIEIFYNGKNYGLRVFNTECNEMLPTIMFFNSLEKAEAYMDKFI